MGQEDNKKYPSARRDVLWKHDFGSTVPLQGGKIKFCQMATFLIGRNSDNKNLKLNCNHNKNYNIKPVGNKILKLYYHCVLKNNFFYKTTILFYWW